MTSLQSYFQDWDYVKEAFNECSYCSEVEHVSTPATHYLPSRIGEGGSWLCLEHMTQVASIIAALKGHDCEISKGEVKNNG